MHERPNGHRYTLFHTIRQLSEPIASNLLKPDLYCQRQKCSPSLIECLAIYGLWWTTRATFTIVELFVFRCCFRSNIKKTFWIGLSPPPLFATLGTALQVSMQIRKYALAVFAAASVVNGGKLLPTVETALKRVLILSDSWAIGLTDRPTQANLYGFELFVFRANADGKR